MSVNDHAPHRFGLLLGSNVADDAMLARACIALRREGSVLAQSRTVRSPSLAPTDDSVYYNQALIFRTRRPHAELARRVKEIERELGRERASAQCLIDIDLLTEYDAAGRTIWEAPHKLAYSLFRTLLDEAWKNAFASDRKTLR